MPKTSDSSNNDSCKEASHRKQTSIISKRLLAKQITTNAIKTTPRYYCCLPARAINDAPPAVSPLSTTRQNQGSRSLLLLGLDWLKTTTTFSQSRSLCVLYCRGGLAGTPSFSARHPSPRVETRPRMPDGNQRRHCAVNAVITYRYMWRIWEIYEDPVRSSRYKTRSRSCRTS